ncbi:hypothetical protein [Acetobacterium tundrae]|uniref:Uncharacterized protein n=1 Tax=Acetobacterium tundrae TaxID=132932 RepID=A0ABR6WP70_9FIRM|nr:hypothetical protein [Acetobacterium tundrae]MBC3798096.1 hypothetical protein [Acetobacterium tundrae]
MNNGLVSTNNINLPNALDATLPQINEIMKAFNLPRDILASDAEIAYAWSELPREIMRIPPELRDGLIVRMCVATSVGLFDGAINYIWNSVIITLKQKVKNFGLSLVASTLGKSFDEQDLNNYMDSQLLDMCYKLELLSEDGYFFLNQCRDIRNNFSSAHPSIAQIDDRELINFISRCCKYGITNDYLLQGVHVSDFLSSIKGRKLDEDELEIWKQRLIETFPAQRQLLIPMLMGIYCDPDSSETTRLNALKICLLIIEYIDDKTKSSMIEQYNRYFVKGDTDKCTAAKRFFEKLKMLNLLSTSEQHSIVKNACKNLLNAHLEFNNFYNEPPFAQRLLEITSSLKTPETVQNEYVYTVLMGYIGNPYGVSNAAIYFYEEMIRNFSPREIDYLLKLNNLKSLFTEKTKNYKCCRERYVMALKMIDNYSMNTTQLAQYDKLIKMLE